MIEQIATGNDLTNEMNLFERVTVLAAVLLAGCGTTSNVAKTSYHVTRDVAVGSYRVATAPVHYAFKRHSNEPTMVGTTDAIQSDVTQPGHPAPSTQVASAPQPQRKTVTDKISKDAENDSACRLQRNHAARTKTIATTSLFHVRVPNGQGSA